MKASCVTDTAALRAPRVFIESVTPSQRLLTPTEVAGIVRVSPATARRWVSEGKLEAVRLGDSPSARIRVQPEALAKFLRGGPDKDAA